MTVKWIIGDPHRYLSGEEKPHSEDCSRNIALNTHGCLALGPSLWLQQAVPGRGLVF